MTIGINLSMAFDKKDLIRKGDCNVQRVPEYEEFTKEAQEEHLCILDGYLIPQKSII